MQDNKNKTRLIIGILLLVILVLLIAVAYAFAIKPAITGNMIKAQNQGYATAIVSIMERASQCQQVPLTFGNKTIEVVWIECLQQAELQ